MKAIILLNNGTVNIMELNYEMREINIPYMSQFINDNNYLDYDVYELTGSTTKNILIYEYSKSVKNRKQKL